jgi:hypothetical protein
VLWIESRSDYEGSSEEEENSYSRSSNHVCGTEREDTTEITLER